MGKSKKRLDEAVPAVIHSVTCWLATRGQGGNLQLTQQEADRLERRAAKAAEQRRSSGGSVLSRFATGGVQ
jgi:hypothetical protein